MLWPMCRFSSSSDLLPLLCSSFLFVLSVLAYFGIDPSDTARNVAVVLVMIIFFRGGCAFLLNRKPAVRG